MERANVERALIAQLDQPRSALVRRVAENNRIWLHNYKAPMAKSLACALTGCAARFDITLVPGQVVYPKFCPEHRSLHRREHHLQRLLGSQGARVVECLTPRDPLPEASA